MATHHHYSITEVENMIPFERDIYMTMLQEYLIQLEEQERQNGRR